MSMNVILNDYLKRVHETLRRGDAREESFYGVLSDMITKIGDFMHSNVDVTTLPKQTEAGCPDFRIWDGSGKVIGYIEAKTPDKNLDHIENTEQLKRYLAAFPNVILTNFLEFRAYRDGQRTQSVLIGQPDTLLNLNKQPPLQDAERFGQMLEKFFAFTMPSITTARELAMELAKRARFLRDEVVEQELADTRDDPTLKSLMQAFKTSLLPQLTGPQFADLFAQTVTYGLFAARLQNNGAGFDRRHAHEAIPASLGVLSHLMETISILRETRATAVLIDDIVSVLDATDINAIKQDMSNRHSVNDPLIHFYETFLAAYDPGLRERRGVYYTPDQVVEYIVGSIDHLLRQDFGITDGLAADEVTVLDPAAGTMTFPVHVIRRIHRTLGQYGSAALKTRFRPQVIKNVHAFELMLAPYVVGHLKAGLVMDELKAPLNGRDRFRLYLTNTLMLEKISEQHLGIMEQQLAMENIAAYKIKQEESILVILGNPPYSGHSANKNPWIDRLMKEKTMGLQDYYTVDHHGLNERNSKWLQDDYVKFIRFAQWKINQVPRGVVGFITNHSWLDNPTFRGMRQSLLNTFSRIYVLNLHGNSKKKEKTPSGGKDENVFDIQQGVAVSIFVKSNDHKGPCEVFYADLWGRRDKKYGFLEKNSVETTNFTSIKPGSPWYWMVPVDNMLESVWNSYPAVNSIFVASSVGIVTARDRLTIGWTKDQVWNTVLNFSRMEAETARIAYKLGKDVRDWKVSLAQKDLIESGLDKDKITPILYRPFDLRWTYYTGKTKGFICMPRRNVMRHMLEGENLGLVVGRQGQVVGEEPWNLAYLTDKIVDFNLYYRGGGQNFPLYSYSDSATEGKKREPNIRPQVFEALAQAHGDRPSPEELLFYIYAVLYSTVYRQKYGEFLRRDFPRVPFTSDRGLFAAMSGLGRRLKDLHLLRGRELSPPVSAFEGQGDSIVARVRWDEQKQRVWINKNQYFTGVDQTLWEYRIGGYQVLDKYLKDRKGLRMDDPIHYIHVITALSRTMDIQKRIDELFPACEADTVSISISTAQDDLFGG